MTAAKKPVRWRHVADSWRYLVNASVVLVVWRGAKGDYQANVERPLEGIDEGFSEVAASVCELPTLRAAKAAALDLLALWKKHGGGK